MGFKAISSQNQNKNNLFKVLNLKNLTNKSNNSSVSQIQKEISEISIILHTSDYIKETVGSVTDLLQSLLASPFGERVDFTEIEKQCLKVINKAVVGLKSYFLASYPGFGDYSAKKVEFNERIRLIAEDLRGVVGSVYLGKVLSGVCREIVSDWQDSMLTGGRRIKDGENQRLVTEFTEIRDILLSLGKDEEGENISKLYINLVTKSSEKTLNLIKMLGINNAQLLDNLGSFKSSVSNSELEKILSIKGFKKSEIQKIMSKF
jgi:hypothetical protein